MAEDIFAMWVFNNLEKLCSEEPYKLVITSVPYPRTCPSVWKFSLFLPGFSWPVNCKGSHQDSCCERLIQLHVTLLTDWLLLCNGDEKAVWSFLLVFFLPPHPPFFPLSPCPSIPCMLVDGVTAFHSVISIFTLQIVYCSVQCVWKISLWERVWGGYPVIIITMTTASSSG